MGQVGTDVAVVFAETLVSLITINGDPEQSTATQALQQQLQQHGIALEDGLPFLSQSLSQYKTVAGLFHQHTGQTGRLLSQLAAAGDLTKIFHAVHSLKSLACIIGAKDLADTARRVEQKCSQGETEYVRLAIQLLQYELELVRQGIGGNLLAADSSSGDADRIPSAPAANKAVLLERAAFTSPTITVRKVGRRCESCLRWSRIQQIGNGWKKLVWLSMN